MIVPSYAYSKIDLRQFNHGNGWMLSRHRVMVLAGVVSAMIGVGIAFALYYAAEQKWPWQPTPSGIGEVVGGTLVTASTPPQTVNPISKLFDPGWVNGQLPGAVTFTIVDDSTGPNGLQFRTTFRWTPPSNTAGIVSYYPLWQYANPSHSGTRYTNGYLGTDGVNSKVPASQTSFTFTPTPWTHVGCSSCVQTGNNSCIQFYVVSCSSVTCGAVPSQNTIMPNAMACYNPSDIYGFNPCCSCYSGGNYC